MCPRDEAVATARAKSCTFGLRCSRRSLMARMAARALTCRLFIKSQISRFLPRSSRAPGRHSEVASATFRVHQRPACCPTPPPPYPPACPTRRRRAPSRATEFALERWEHGYWPSPAGAAVVFHDTPTAQAQPMGGEISRLSRRPRPMGCNRPAASSSRTLGREEPIQ